ncbi:hypothetical protein [Streptomyces marianii]|uniref:Tetratricopeptide repeat protein n=1 Tax=Streptomyces marianii TaxID=1817406 RepID=A0A5R9DSL0_9ACTN|nr:hypothetical protein [Streptomyces marianii]TLQ39014.1 hypothetical protein FEF34_40095 [Streptomyces marianii]
MTIVPPQPSTSPALQEPLYAPWGSVTAAFWMTADGAPAPTPAVLVALRERLAEVAAAAVAGQLDQAVRLATELDREITAQYGEPHIHTIEVREVRGYLAHLTGDHAAAVGWYLHAARLRSGVQGRSHPDTAQATRRAYSLWRAMPATVDRHPHGVELLATVIDIHGPDAAVVHHTRKRLESLVLPSTASTQA